MGLVWKHTLPTLVNSVAISDDGSLVAAATYYYPYPGTTKPRTDGKFGTYVFDAHGNELWRDLYEGNEGLYSVAVSGKPPRKVTPVTRQTKELPPSLFLSDIHLTKGH